MESKQKEYNEGPLLDAAVLENMNLEPEMLLTISSALSTLNWLKVIAEEEEKTIHEIDLKLVLKRFLNIELTNEQIHMAKNRIQEDAEKYARKV